MSNKKNVGCIESTYPGSMFLTEGERAGHVIDARTGEDTWTDAYRKQVEAASAVIVLSTMEAA